MIERSKLSEKAKFLIKSSDCIFSEYHSTSYNDVYDPITNRNGCISLLWSENTLCFDLLKPKLMIPLSSEPSITTTRYSESGGLTRFRVSIANLLSTRVFKTNLDQVNPKNIAVAAGTTAILDGLIYSICDPKDIIIIPSPMYSFFPKDVKIKFQVRVVPAPLEVIDDENPDKIQSFKLNLETFESIYNENPGKVKCVLLCNPNNPTGHVFSKEELYSVVKWCREKQIHLISDEIYALSVFNHEKAQFTSIFDICDGELGDFIHIVNGFSKDFGLNGLRAGYIYSENSDVLTILDYFQHQLCSNLVQEPDPSIDPLLVFKPNSVEIIDSEDLEHYSSYYLLFTLNLDLEDIKTPTLQFIPFASFYQASLMKKLKKLDITLGISSLLQSLIDSLEYGEGDEDIILYEDDLEELCNCDLHKREFSTPTILEDSILNWKNAIVNFTSNSSINHLTLRNFVCDECDPPSWYDIESEEDGIDKEFSDHFIQLFNIQSISKLVLD
eukprot:gene1238-1562_t